MPSSIFEGIVATAASAWAASNAFMTGTKLINERRHAVILGKLKDHPLTPEHKRLILYSDWLQMQFGIGLLLIVAIGAWIVLPWLFVEKFWNAFWLSVPGAFALIAVGCPFVIGGVAEFRLMKRSIDASQCGVADQ